MKKILLIVTLLCLGITLWAVPTERTRVKVRLVDGSEIFVTTFGDEHLSWMQTDDGQVVLPAEDRPGLYVRSSALPETLVAESDRRRTAARRIGSKENSSLPVTGNPKVAVVLVNFQDSVFSVGKTDEEIRAYYELYWNGTRNGHRYTGHGSYGSVRDYFIAQSDSLFQPEFVIIGPVTLDEGVATYGQNSGSSKDVGFSSFIKESITKAMKVYDGDWTQFDNKGRGGNYVDLMFFLFAGCGENTVQTQPYLLWAKEQTVTYTVTLDNGKTVSIGTSACGPENRCKTWNESRTAPASVASDGIGVTLHEVSHALGLPDFYDTRSNASGFGMDIWSLMDYGCYMQNGNAPVGYTAYERDFLGWRPLEVLTEAGPYTLDAIASETGRGLKMVNPENKDEYYVLEARLNSGWDTALSKYGKGLQVTHVDWSGTQWNSNKVNTVTDHQRMTIIAANNRYVGSTISGDMAEWRKTWSGNLYPYIYKDEEGVEHCNDSLTANSLPVAKVFTAAGTMPHKLTKIAISEDGKCVSLMYNEDQYDAVRDLQTAGSKGIATGTFDLSGRRVKDARKSGMYLIDGRKVVIVQ